MLWNTHPQDAERYLEQAQNEVNHRYHHYEQLASLEWDGEEGEARTQFMATLKKPKEIPS